MSYPSLQLDDRQFQDIVDEAKKRLGEKDPEWTAHNVSDPGITLVELFAWMTELILYRLNQVPDRNLIAFMKLLGIGLKPPRPAKAKVTFYLSQPLPNTVSIPKATEVATTQTETQKAIVFTTDYNFEIVPPTLEAVRVGTSDGYYGQPLNLTSLEAGQENVLVFSESPQANEALYFGFANDLSFHLLGLNLVCEDNAGGDIVPELPPIKWEAANGPRWQDCDVEEDKSEGLNKSGHVHLHLPQMGRHVIEGQDLYWVRVRVRGATEMLDEMDAYQTSPELHGVTAASWGGTIHVTNVGYSRENEIVGVSDGTTGQRFRLRHAPVLPRRPGERLEVVLPGLGNGANEAADEQIEVWQEVAHFGDSTLHNTHYTLDSNTGEIYFGPASRQLDGTLKRYGCVPPYKAQIRFTRYRYGGGSEGNVLAHRLDTLLNSIPSIDKVTNRFAAEGGRDGESFAAAKVRAPHAFTTRDRAVTAADFEFLAQQVEDVNIRRVKCLQPEPSGANRVGRGNIHLLLIAGVDNENIRQGRLSAEQLRPLPADVTKIKEYLDERRLLTTHLKIDDPQYFWVAVRVTLQVMLGADEIRVIKDVRERLYRFLNPLVGGPDGRGWPFGRDLHIADIYAYLQDVVGLGIIRHVTLHEANSEGKIVGQGQQKDSIEVFPNGVIASGIHEVELYEP